MRPFVIALAAASLLGACQSEQVADEAQAAPNAAETAPADSPAISPENVTTPAAAETPSPDNAAATPGTARKVRCRVAGSGSPPFEGECLFEPDREGSFALSRAGEMPLVEGVAMVSVAIVAPGRAEVRGLTTDGINSRWGEAIRSEADPACWRGSDFEICAW